MDQPTVVLYVWMCEDDGQMAQWDEENLFFYHFIFSASCCNAIKKVLIFRFYLELHCHNGLTMSILCL